MKKIYEAALLNADMSVVKSNLITLLNSIEESSERAVEILIGMDIKEDELPKCTIDSQDRVCTMTSCDYLQDKVRYEYTRENANFYKTEEDAKAYSKGENPKDSNWRQTEEYPFKGTRMVKDSSYTSFDNWLSRKVKN